MRLKPIALFLALAFAAVPASSCTAAPFTPGMNHAFSVAAAYWGATPALCSTIDKQIVPEGTLAGDDIGEATLPLELEPCTLYLTKWLAKPLQYGPMCLTMMHEYGHLLGLDHTAAPGDVMNPATAKPPKACAKKSA